MDEDDFPLDPDTARALLPVLREVQAARAETRAMAALLAFTWRGLAAGAIDSRDGAEAVMDAALDVLTAEDRSRAGPLLAVMRQILRAG